jgi:hypothetical protein
MPGYCDAACDINASSPVGLFMSFAPGAPIKRVAEVHKYKKHRCGTDVMHVRDDFDMVVALAGEQRYAERCCCGELAHKHIRSREAVVSKEKGRYGKQKTNEYGL